MQLLGADLVHRADHAAEYMIETVIGPRALDRRDVARLPHHADACGVARGVLADGALVTRGVVKATAAKMNLLLDGKDGVGQAARFLNVRFQQVIRDALGRLGTNARKSAQLIEKNL